MGKNELSDYKKREIEKVKRLVKQYFWWLVDEYGLTRPGDYSHFQNDKVWVEISLGHKSPRVYLCRVGDDPFHYMSAMGYVIEFLDKSFRFERNYLKHPLEENVSYYANLFRRYADRLILDFDSWWIPYQVFHYKKFRKKAEEKGDLQLFLKVERYLYDYLIANGVPASELDS